MCGDLSVVRDVKSLLVKKTGREMMGIVGIPPGEQQAAMLDEQTDKNQTEISAFLDADAVTMNGYDEKTRKRECQADIKAGDSKAAFAQYTVQLTEDGKQYVVFAKFATTDGKPPAAYIDLVRSVYPDIAKRIDEVIEAERIEQERKNRLAALRGELEETVEAAKRAWRIAPMNLRLLFPKTDYELSTRFSDACTEGDEEERVTCQIGTAKKVHEFITEVTNGKPGTQQPTPTSPAASQSARGNVSDRPV